MTTEEAKKAGFRSASGALYVYWCIENGHIYVRSCDACALTGNDFPTRAKAREALRKRKENEEVNRKSRFIDNFVQPMQEHLSSKSKADAEHAKWLADMQSQTAPITPEQAKMLREGDRIYGFKYGCVDAEHLVCFENPVTVGCVDDIGIIKAGKAYFTLAAAQAALDKAKAEAEPLEWCEYNEGYRLSPEAFISFDDGKTWTTVTGKFIGVCYSERLGIRARYRNPLWLAKHGKSVESHETPVGETQGKEVVTDETQPTILEEAAKCVTGPRRRDYGTPDENFSLIASLWSVQLKHEVTPMQVAMCLILLKVARQSNSPKRDNLVDIAGYAQCASELKGAK